MNASFWNDRYRSHATVYGDEPNVFFKAQLDQHVPGKLLLPAEGEGRNAIYAATRNWQVTAFDFSEQAQHKALANAKKAGVLIDYTVQDISTVILPPSHYDLVALIYVHLPPPIRLKFFEQCVQSLKPGGRVLLEGFSIDQLQHNSGGPKDPEMLYTADALPPGFQSVQIELLKQETILLREGDFHQGPASVVRLVARKPD